MTQLRTLKVIAPLCDMAVAPRDASRHAWSAAARIVNYAFSDKCLSSMPCLQNLSIDLQHVNMRTSRPGEALQQSENRPSARDDFCAWDLPTCQLKSFSLSGVALGDRQLNYKQATKVRRMFIFLFVLCLYVSAGSVVALIHVCATVYAGLQDFWGSLQHLEIGHTAVSDDLQATALKAMVCLAKNVQSLNVASLEELLSKLASNPMSPVCASPAQPAMCSRCYLVLHRLDDTHVFGYAAYVTLSKLEHLSTTLVGKLSDVQRLTRLELRSCKSYVNLRLVAESLPQLRVLEGLPFKPGTDHRFYWPLRQCSKLEKLVTSPG